MFAQRRSRRNEPKHRPRSGHRSLTKNGSRVLRIRDRSVAKVVPRRLRNPDQMFVRNAETKVKECVRRRIALTNVQTDETNGEMMDGVPVGTISAGVVLAIAEGPTNGAVAVRIVPRSERRP